MSNERNFNRENGTDTPCYSSHGKNSEPELNRERSKLAHTQSVKCRAMKDAVICAVAFALNKETYKVLKEASEAVYAHSTQDLFALRSLGDALVVQIDMTMRGWGDRFSNEVPRADLVWYEAGAFDPVVVSPEKEKELWGIPDMQVDGLRGVGRFLPNRATLYSLDTILPYIELLSQITAIEERSEEICEKLQYVHHPINNKNFLTFVRDELVPKNIAITSRKDTVIVPGERRGRGDQQLVYRVPILEITDRMGLPIKRGGKGDTLERRIVVLTLAHVDMTDRVTDRPLRVNVPIRQLREWLFPRVWSAPRHWPRIRRALDEIHTAKITLPNGNEWYPITIAETPPLESDRDVLDKHVCLNVNFRDDFTRGAVVQLDPLIRIGATSGPRFCAVVAARTLLWAPGKTRIPTKGSASGYAWSHHATNYPILTIADRRRLAFGDREVRLPHKQINDAWRDDDLESVGVCVLDRNAKEPKTGRVGWRIVPLEVKDKIINE